MWTDLHYELHPSFVSSDRCQLIDTYVRLRHDSGRLGGGDSRVPDASRIYADDLTEALLLDRQHAVENAVGEPLMPTYSYLRLHKHGSSMPVHTDRAASEIGVSITISSDHLWPLWLRSAAGDIEAPLHPGDAVIYSGMKLPHWRLPFAGSWQVQVMLFYVRANGPYADWRYDLRRGIGHDSIWLLPGAQNLDIYSATVPSSLLAEVHRS